MGTLCQNILRDATVLQELRRRLLLIAVIALALGQSISGCDPIAVIPKEVALSGNIPPQQSVVYGQISIEGLPKTLLDSSKVRLEFQNLTTNERSGYSLEKEGIFTLPLLPGRYAVTSVWSGFQTIEPGKGATPVLFAVPPGTLVYIGTLLIRVPSAATDGRGEIVIRDEFGAATLALSERYAPLIKNNPPLKGLMITVPAKAMDGILVDVVLSRRLVALMLLDNDSPNTILTRDAAKEFGVQVDKQSAGTNLQTYRGAILSPLMRLKSIRLGALELPDVEVVVDVDGYFPIGILGKSVLRQLKFTVDQNKKQVQFSR